ncbi:hypothetical protein ACJMK2_029995 [Sinanodonta woodiana]|uniref:ATP synthase subunit b n=1 Tax=Sinanodonta woodiana TaxID=1069815 RepID=A0ABD3XFJ4_SINWO
MLSALVPRFGSSRVLLRFCPPQRVLSVAGASTKTPAQSKPDATSNTVTDPEDNLPQHERWMQINKVFYGPERDLVNYPHPKMKEVGDKVRLGIIPEELFQWLYPKTGVTGPYIFIWGGVAYLLSKEIVVLDHSFSHAVGFVLAVWYLRWKLGPMAEKFFTDFQKQHVENIYLNPVKKGKKVHELTIEQLEKEIWRQDGQKYLYEAKRENVALQLEAEYRRRMDTVYEQVRRRLNYQLDMETAKRRHEQEHMVNWIVSNVVKNITPQQEKESIASCIKNLKQLASVQPAV